MDARSGDGAGSTDPAAPWADVGLVVVHGIGEQARGATLLDWAEPITRRLDEIARSVPSPAFGTRRRWAGVAEALGVRSWAATAGVPGTGVEVVRSQIVDTDRSEVRLLVRLGPDVECRVIIREARWADAFLTVSSSDVLTWGRRFSVRAMRRLLAHLGRTLRLFGSVTSSGTDALANAVEIYERKIPDWVPFAGSRPVSLAIRLVGFLLVVAAVAGGLGLLAVFGPLALLLITVGTLGLAILAKIPLLGKRVNAILAGLVLSVGDATSWTERPLRAAAMRDRVRDVIDGIDARKVVVLGHSQGAAVSAEAVLGPGAADDGRTAVLLTVGGAVSLLRAPGWSVRDSEDVPGAVARWSTKPGLSWANIWATWDPVPSGPVTDTDAEATKRWREVYQPGVADVEARAAASRRELDILEDPDWASLGDRLRASALQAPPPAAAPSLRLALGLEPRRLGDGMADILAAIAKTQAAIERRQRTELESLGAAIAPAEVSDRAASAVAGPAEWPVHNRASIVHDHTTYTTNVRQVIDPVARMLVRVGGKGANLAAFDTDAAAQHVNAVRLLGALRLSSLVTSIVGLVALSSRGIELPIIDWLIRAVRPLSGPTATGLTWIQDQSWEGIVSLVLTSTLVAAVLVAVGVSLWGRWHRAYSWDDSRRVAAPAALFVAYYAMTVLTPTVLVTIGLEQLWGWWVWLLAVAVGLALLAWPLFGLRPQPLAGRRVRREPVDQVVAPPVP